jgi:hypothetical protein
MRASHEQYRAALMDSSFDPHKWVAEQDKDRAEREAHMKDSRTAWLAVWDSLDAAQRTQVREFLFARADHEHRGHWAHHEDQHGEEGHGMPGAAGPAKQ